MSYLTAKEAYQQAFKLQDEVVTKILDDIFIRIDLESKSGNFELNTTFTVPEYCRKLNVYEKVAEVITKHGYKITYSLQSFPKYNITLNWKEAN